VIFNKREISGVSLLVLLLVTGCIIQPKASQPMVRATWKGRAETVDVTDDDGAVHSALAIDIMEGPDWRRGKPGPLPLLTLRDKTILQRGDLDGRIVTVSGTMGTFPAYTYTPVLHRSGARVSAERIVDGKKPVMEFIIQLDEDPLSHGGNRDGE
jgi:hypothetical protein